ncbi:MAG: HEAT repeat domain-containing protein [SAR202 cluster bacterium]|nr:HEAT repeat domain-containing protein [SAR202 cluster bacterium]
MSFQKTRKCPEGYPAPQVPENEKEKKVYLRKATAEAKEAAAPLLRELADIGVNVESIWDLVNYNFDYRQAVPILIDWLPRMQNIRVREAIVRALTVKFASPAAIYPLLIEFECGSEFIKWEVGNALAEVADKSVFDDILRLVKEPQHGTARQELIISLGRLKDKRAIPTLVNLLRDPDVQGHAINALRLLSATEARSAIEPFLAHEKAWIRREAKSALGKFDKLGKDS